MTLRRAFLLQQSIFLILGAGVLSLMLPAAAQAQETIELKNRPPQAVKIVGVTATGVTVQVGAGTTVFPFASIAKVEMAAPVEYTTGLDAYAAKNYASAAANLGIVARKYRGLPTVWAQNAMATLGDVELALNDLPKAEQAYAAFQKTYPGAGGTAATVGAARIAFAKKDYATARQKLTPIAEAALKTPDPAPELAHAYSQTFYVLGQLEEQAGNFPAALEDYLRTVTLFYQDAVALNNAQEHADALQKAHQVAVP